VDELVLGTARDAEENLMVFLNPIVDFLPTTTRQTLYDMWNAPLGDIPVTELTVNFRDVNFVSSPSDYPNNPTPGALVWNRVEQLMYCFHDWVDGTAVSLWMAIGPDRFDVACLAAEPLASGDAVEPVHDRWVRKVRGWRQQTGGLPRVLGFNQFGIYSPITESTIGGNSIGTTAASGAWVNVGVDGLMWALLSNQASYPSESFAYWNSTRFFLISEATTSSQTIIVPVADSVITKRLPVAGMTFTSAMAANTEPLSAARILTKVLFGPRVISTDLFSG
jgi:hypothetical protein